MAQRHFFSILTRNFLKYPQEIGDVFPLSCLYFAQNVLIEFAQNNKKQSHGIPSAFSLGPSNLEASEKFIWYTHGFEALSSGVSPSSNSTATEVFVFFRHPQLGCIYSLRVLKRMTASTGTATGMRNANSIEYGGTIEQVLFRDFTYDRETHL